MTITAVVVENGRRWRSESAEVPTMSASVRPTWARILPPAKIFPERVSQSEHLGVETTSFATNEAQRYIYLLLDCFIW
jgi:hypothetical protein